MLLCQASASPVEQFFRGVMQFIGRRKEGR
jgi:hypothetical protein